MYKSFDDLIEAAQKMGEKRKIAVVKGADKGVIEAMKMAAEKQMAEPVFIDDEKKLKELGADFKGALLVHAESEQEAAAKGVELIKKDRAQMLMKGKIKTGTFLKAVVNKETGITGKNILSHVLVFEKDNQLRIVTDGGMIPEPDLNQKVEIIKNASTIMKSIGAEVPRVAPLCAVETVNPDMKDTVEAALLTQMNRRKQIKDCIVDGPLALDNAVSEEAAAQKGIVSDVAGKADILVVPDIEAGNILGKSLIYFARAESGGLIAGAQAPVIMLSRADTSKTKLNSIALAIVCSSGRE
ncbi:MAG: bifunctional enoyl-CoA hydratase/phosphate acetyltransferase [Candidatus Muiribacteriota bacterium]